MTELDENPSERAYIGCVEFVSRSYDGPRFARVMPLLRSTRDGTAWEGPINDATERFPERGEVFWWDVPEFFESGDYVQFHIRRARGYDPPEKPEMYEVISAKPPIEVIDVRRGWPEAHLRRQFTGPGIYLQTNPVGQVVMIWYERHTWVGPVKIEPAGEPHMWKIADQEDLSRLEALHPPEKHLRAIKALGGRIFLSPALELGEHLRFRNWMPDSQLAKGLLSRIRRFDRDVFDALDVTYSVFDSYQDLLEKAGLTGDSRDQFLGRRERIEELRTTLAENRELLEDAVSTLMGMPEVRRGIDERRLEIYEQAKKDQEERVEAELGERRRALTEANKRIDSAEKRLRDLDAEITRKGEELEQELDSFKSVVRDRLRELIESPEKAFSEIAVLRGLLGLSEAGKSGPEPSDHDDSSAPPTPVSPPPLLIPESLDDAAEVIRILGRTFRNFGFSPLLGVDLHSIFLSGAAPVVTGGAAYEALSAYATAVAAGHLLWIPISASVLEPQDLLGRFDSAANRILPHPGGLLDVLRTAEETGDSYIVVLEGFNRAPVESYLLPLMESRLDGWTGRSGRQIPLVSHGLVNASSKYGRISRVGWPPNVLLSLIPAAGTISFPIGPGMWQYAALLDSGGAAPPLRAPEAEGAGVEARSQVTRSLWAEWRQGAQTAGREHVHQALDTLRSNGPLPTGAMVTENIYSAARVLALSEEKALELALKSSFLPSLRKPTQPQLESIVALGVQSEDAQNIAELSAELMS